MTQVPGGSAYKSNARFVPQAVGVVADIAAVSTLLVGGGKAIVLTASFGAVLLGSYVIWKRWGGTVDRALAGGVAVAIAGAGVFGYSMAEPMGSPGLPSGASSGESPSTTTQAKTSLTIVPGQPTTPPLPSRSNQSPSIPPTASGVTWLVDMQRIESDRPDVDPWVSKTVRVKSVTYSKSLVADKFWCGHDHIEYAVDGSRFSRLKAMVGLADDSPRTEPGSTDQFPVIIPL